VDYHGYELPDRPGFAGMLLEDQPNDGAASRRVATHDAGVSTGARSPETRAALAAFRATIARVIDLTDDQR
jgi:hypothetical protein